MLNLGMFLMLITMCIDKPLENIQLANLIRFAQRFIEMTIWILERVVKILVDIF